MLEYFVDLDNPQHEETIGAEVYIFETYASSFYASSSYAGESRIDSARVFKKSAVDEDGMAEVIGEIELDRDGDIDLCWVSDREDRQEELEECLVNVAKSYLNLNSEDKSFESRVCINKPDTGPTQTKLSLFFSIQKPTLAKTPEPNMLKDTGKLTFSTPIKQILGAKQAVRKRRLDFDEDTRKSPTVKSPAPTPVRMPIIA